MQYDANGALIQTEIPGLKLINRGKVRDVYDLGDALLFVATDRLSAFDVVMPNGVPRKGEVLTQISLFWFDLMRDIPNHLISADVASRPELTAYVKDLQGQITKLQGDLKAKDDEYAAKEADRVFMDSVKEAVKAAGGRNEKAVIAMLNIDALKESKNQSEDIKKALEDVKKSDGYLFGTNEPINNPVGGTSGGGGADPGADDVAALRAAMGLPEK